MATILAWAEAWRDMKIAGVDRLDDPPTGAIAASDLPAGWPDTIDSEFPGFVTSCADMSKRRGMVYQIAIAPLGEDVQAGNFWETIGLADAVETAIETFIQGVVVNFVTYQIRVVADIQLGTTPYWGLRVEAEGYDITS